MGVRVTIVINTPPEYRSKKRMVLSKPPIISRLFSPGRKTAIVTGGARGIGRMIASGFVESGIKTYITSRNAEECRAVAEELCQLGECAPLSFDLSSIAGISEMVTTFGGCEESLDILVNNAGATWGAPFAEYPVSGWDKVLDLNLRSPFFLTQSLFPFLQAAGKAEDPARVINIASINGLTCPHMNNYAYSASKAGFIHLTRHLAADLARDNINVNAIAPGFFPTKMTSHLGEEADAMVSAIPRGAPGQPDDAAGAAIFLCSRASAWITGVTLPVDGGMAAAA